jgi:hypothetical protein
MVGNGVTGDRGLGVPRKAKFDRTCMSVHEIGTRSRLSVAGSLLGDW